MVVEGPIRIISMMSELFPGPLFSEVIVTPLHDAIQSGPTRGLPLTEF